MPAVLITGASTGIGRATALRLAESGWTVFAGVRDAEAAERLHTAGGESFLQSEAGAGEPLRASASETGPSKAPVGNLIPIALDVTDAAQIAAAAEQVHAHTGASGLDALVNNAGIGVSGPLELIALEDLRLQLEVNVLGQVAVTQALLPALRRARGRIVFVSSLGGRVALPFSAPYAASKHAIEAIGDALRGELRSSGISVTLVEPGSVATPIWAKSRALTELVHIPPELARHYGHVPATFARVLQNTERRAIPPERVAHTIERALTTKSPRARYLLGRDARTTVLAKALLPTPIFDRLVGRTLGV
jgi:NAD(P)-dependent dehydrogenase (short-subunit alcohol dehydrogenase family)